MPSTHNLLAYDLGASSGRALLGKLAGDRLEVEEVHRFETPIIEEGGHLYWNIAEIWEEIQEGFRQAREAAEPIESVSVTSWGVDYVPLGDAGRPLRNPFCYRDARLHGRMAEVHERVRAEEIYRITGIQFMEINSLYQLWTDRQTEPELYSRTGTRLTIADYFNHLLGGRPVIERSFASTTQVMDVHRNEWSSELIDGLDLGPSPFAEIVPPGTVLGACGLDESVKVIASCSHDTACAVAGVPAVPGQNWAYISSGTWSLVGAELSAPLVTDEAREAGFTNEAGFGGTIRFLKNLTGLWVLQECVREWRQAGDVIDFEQLMADAEAAPGDPVFIDLDDRRFLDPGNMEARLRSYCSEQNIPVPATRAELVRSILGSLAQCYRRALDELEAVTATRFDVIHVVGGGSLNRLLCEWTADACERPVIAGPAEATGIGNLLIQAHTLGLLAEGVSIRDVVRGSVQVATFQPGND